MNIERILSNNVSILVGQTNTGKTMLLADLMCKYIKAYTSPVYCYGIRNEITDKLRPVVTSFSSIRELERIKNGIIIIDEIGELLDLENRKKKRAIERTLRLITHNNNRLVTAGLPTDFRKFLSAKATCFMYTSLTISDLINGSLVKTTLLDYARSALGSYVLELPAGQVLCYDSLRLPEFWMDSFSYYKEFDTKKDNLSLFKKRA